MPDLTFWQRADHAVRSTRLTDAPVSGLDAIVDAAASSTGPATRALLNNAAAEAAMDAMQEAVFEAVFAATCDAADRPTAPA